MILKLKAFDVFSSIQIKLRPSPPSFSIDFKLDWSYFLQNKIDVVFPKIKIKTRVLIFRYHTVRT